jgi:hypothetical protein
LLVDTISTHQRGLELDEQTFGERLDQRLGWLSFPKRFSSHLRNSTLKSTAFAQRNRSRSHRGMEKPPSASPTSRPLRHDGLKDHLAGVPEHHGPVLVGVLFETDTVGLAPEDLRSPRAMVEDLRR